MDEVGKVLVNVSKNIEEEKGLLPCQGADREHQEGSINGHLKGKLSNRSDMTDEVGEAASKDQECQGEVKVTLHAYGKKASNDRRIEAIDEHQKGKTGLLHSSALGKERFSGVGEVINSFSGQGTYKEALLRRSKTLHPSAILPPKKPIYYQGLKELLTNNLANRCFRRLAKDHKAAASRDPVRCLKCLRFGHRANQYKDKRKYNVVDSMYRPYQRLGHAPVLKVFIPYTEKYLRRLELRRNAVLTDVLQPANLGSDPITTIKNAMARRFGGYTDDFAVARYRERDFAIFLPEWVSAEVLTRRKVLTLNDFSTRCYAWGQYRNTCLGPPF